MERIMGFTGCFFETGFVLNRIKGFKEMQDEQPIQDLDGKDEGMDRIVYELILKTNNYTLTVTPAKAGVS